MKLLTLFLMLGLSCGFYACADSIESDPLTTDFFSKVTFIELGSVSCVPCQKMQPIMKSLEEKYGEEQLDVQFIDVLRDRDAAKPYNIRLMPTQVFLDDKGEEFHRHEGFYPEAGIDSLLQIHGLKPI